MRNSSILREEEGSLLIVGILVLAILSILGIAASTQSEVEIRIAGNDRIFKQNLYLAEGAAMAGAQVLENETDGAILRDMLLDWLHSDLSDLPDESIVDSDNWTDESYSNQASDVSPRQRYLAVYQGIAPGSSLDIGAGTTTLHIYSLYGHSSVNNGDALVEVGYRKRF